MNSASSVRLVAALSVWAALQLASAQNQPPSPPPSGPQSDGAFRKVILDADAEIDGKLADTLKDPMELAVAPDE